MDTVKAARAPNKSTYLGPMAILAIASAATYQVLLLLLVLLRPDLDPTWHTISEWVFGPYGWLMTVAFFVSATAYGAMVFLLTPQLSGPWGKVGLGLLLVCFVGTLGVATFPTDPLPVDPATATVTGTLHTIAGTSALVLLPFAALVINVNLARRNPAWHARRRLLLWGAGIPLIGLLGFVSYTAIFVPSGPTAYGPGVHIGLPPRFALLSYAVWVVSLSWASIKVNEEHDGHDSNVHN
jgi:hypothetical protein